MSKFAKIFTFLIVMILAIIWAVPLFVDFYKYKEPIITQIEKFSNLKVELNGPLRIQIIPSIEIKANQVIVKSNNSEKLMNVEAIHCHISLWKLFKGQFELSDIKMVKPDIYLNDKSINNIDSKKSKPPSSPHQPLDLPLHNAQLLKNFSINNGKFTFFDSKSKAEYLIQNLQVQMHAKDKDYNVLIQGDSGKWQINGNFQFCPEIINNILTIQGKIGLKNNKIKCALMDVKVNIDTYGHSLKAEVHGKDIKIPFKAELPYKTIDLEKSSEFKAQVLAGVPLIQIKNLNFSHPDFNIKGQITFNVDNSNWLDGKMSFNISGSEIIASINSKGKHLSTQEAAYELRSNNIKEALRWICKDVSYPIFNQKVVIKGVLSTSPGKIKLSPIDIMVAHNIAKGSLEINTSQPSYKINLGLDEINPWFALLNKKSDLSGTMKVEATAYSKNSSYDIAGLFNLIGKSKDAPVVDLNIDLKDFIIPNNQPLYAQSNLSGQINCKIKNWMVNGMNLNQIKKVIHHPEQLATSGQLLSNKGQTLINTISGDFVVNKGIATTQNITCNFADGTCHLGGNIDLPNWKLDFNGALSINNLPQVPFLLKGSVDDPNFKLDISSLLLKGGVQILKKFIPSFVR